MLLKLQSELKVFYLDDGTLSGNLEDVFSDFQLVEREAADLGFQLNHTKFELVCGTRDSMVAPRHKRFNVASRSRPSGGRKCRNPRITVGSKRSVHEFINEKIRLLGLMGERLQLL